MIKYQNMIDLPHPAPKYHIRMPIENRAAQFAPFAALTGYEEAVKEARRLTDHKPELSEEEKDILDLELQNATNRADREVIITYFVPDMKKDGGCIVDCNVSIKKVDPNERVLILRNGNKIPLDNILKISIPDIQSDKEKN